MRISKVKASIESLQRTITRVLLPANMAAFSKEFLDDLKWFKRDFYMMSEEDVCPNCGSAGGIEFFEREVSEELTENTGWTKELVLTCHACDYDVADNDEIKDSL